MYVRAYSFEANPLVIDKIISLSIGHARLATTAGQCAGRNKSARQLSAERGVESGVEFVGRRKRDRLWCADSDDAC